MYEGKIQEIRDFKAKALILLEKWKEKNPSYNQHVYWSGHGLLIIITKDENSEK